MAAIIVDGILKIITNDWKNFLCFHVRRKRFCIVRKITKINEFYLQLTCLSFSTDFNNDYTFAVTQSYDDKWYDDFPGVYLRNQKQ